MNKRIKLRPASGYIPLVLLLAVIGILGVLNRKPANDSQSAFSNYQTNALSDLLLRAKKGDAAAQYEIGITTLQRQATSNECREAIEWIQKAAEQQWPDAECAIGFIYSKGEFLPRNDEEANRWIFMV